MAKVKIKQIENNTDALKILVQNEFSIVNNITQAAIENAQLALCQEGLGYEARLALNCTIDKNRRILLALTRITHIAEDALYDAEELTSVHTLEALNWNAETSSFV